MKKVLTVLVAALLLTALSPASFGSAEEEVYIGQASYWSPETVEKTDLELVNYDGDPHDLLLIVSLEGEESIWLVVPEGVTAGDYLGKGIRYTIAEIIREQSDADYKMLRAKTMEAFADSAEGTLREISATEAVVDVTLTSATHEFTDETMRFTITPETKKLTPVEVGSPVDVLYDAEMNALYLIRRNG